MDVQYVVDGSGRRVSVILPVEEHERMVEALEDSDDVRLYDEARTAQESGDFEVVPLGPGHERARSEEAKSRGADGLLGRPRA